MGWVSNGLEIKLGRRYPRREEELGVDPWEEGYTEDDEDDEEAEDEGKKAIL